MLNPPTKKQKNEENMATRKVVKLRNISPRAARLHPKLTGGKRKEREGTMATDDVINPHTRTEKESRCILCP